MSVVFEQGKDLVEERRIGDAFAGSFGDFVAKKTEKLNAFDFHLQHKNGIVVAIFEVKRRYCVSGKYQTLMISRKKIDKCMKEAKDLCVPFALVVGWDDGIGWMYVHKDTHCNRGVGGRPRRIGSVNDKEEMLYFDVRQFKMLEEP